MSNNNSGGQYRLRVLAAALLAFIAAACTSSGGESSDALTAGDVEAAWRAAVECLSERGYSGTAEEGPYGWSMAFEGELDETPDFMSAYDDCVSDADEVSRAFLRSQIPEGAERLELAESFDGCIEAVGLQPLRYDPNNADEVAALAEVVTQLGYQLGDTGVADNERFGRALDCFQSHELLFPGRFESD